MIQHLLLSALFAITLINHEGPEVPQAPIVLGQDSAKVYGEFGGGPVKNTTTTCSKISSMDKKFILFEEVDYALGFFLVGYDYDGDQVPDFMTGTQILHMPNKRNADPVVAKAPLFYWKSWQGKKGSDGDMKFKSNWEIMYIDQFLNDVCQVYLRGVTSTKLEESNELSKV